MRGLLHLDPIPLVGKTSSLARLLRRCIRNAANTDSDRNMALEELYAECLSYYNFQGYHLIRCSTVDCTGGQLPINEGTVETLWDETKRVLLMNYTCYGAGDYNEYYNPDRFNTEVKNGDYLFTPDRYPYVRNLVALHTHRPKKRETVSY